MLTHNVAHDVETDRLVREFPGDFKIAPTPKFLRT